MRVFLRDVILRPSCYDCKAKGGRSGSDLTIADFWGIEQLNPNMDDNLGTSLVMVYTEKGSTCFNALQLNSWEAKYEDILRLNPSVMLSAREHPKRRWFFAHLDNCNSVASLIDLTLRTPLGLRIKQLPKRFLRKIRSILGGVNPYNNDVQSFTFHNPTISDLTFRSKRNGWNQYAMEITMMAETDD